PMFSFIVAGCITNRIWNVLLDRAGSRCLYEVRYEAGQSILRKTDEIVSITAGEETQIRAGEGYQIDEGAFHESSVDPNEVAVTLVWMRREQVKGSRVVGDRGGPLEVRFARAEVLSAEAILATREISDALKIRR